MSNISLVKGFQLGSSYKTGQISIYWPSDLNLWVIKYRIYIANSTLL